MIRAVFRGTDGSMGFRTGQVYRFRTRLDPAMGLVIWDGVRSCPYASLEAFLRNWEVQEVV